MADWTKIVEAAASILTIVIGLQYIRKLIRIWFPDFWASGAQKTVEVLEEKVTAVSHKLNDLEETVGKDESYKSQTRQGTVIKTSEPDESQTPETVDQREPYEPQPLLDIVVGTSESRESQTAETVGQLRSYELQTQQRTVVKTSELRESQTPETVDQGELYQSQTQPRSVLSKLCEIERKLDNVTEQQDKLKTTVGETPRLDSPENGSATAPTTILNKVGTVGTGVDKINDTLRGLKVRQKTILGRSGLNSQREILIKVNRIEKTLHTLIYGARNSLKNAKDSVGARHLETAPTDKGWETDSTDDPSP